MSIDNIEEHIFNPNKHLEIPTWINGDYFMPLLEKVIPNYKRITKFSPIAATAPGENYTSIMVRVIIDVDLKDGNSEQISYILKTGLPAGNKGSTLVSAMNLFPKEKQMYAYYIPKFEQLYKNAGVHIELAPKCLHCEETPDNVTLVIEDLKQRQFVNIDRLSGFDMNHIRVVLNKLAELHAASATYRDLNGPFESMYDTSFFTEETLKILTPLYETRIKLFANAMTEWGLEDAEKYIAKMLTRDEFFTKSLQMNISNPQEFNVLNHGDCWSNNIMFAHTKSGEVKESMFVDFQLCKWGTPAQDLWYLITTSVSLNIKEKEFDHFIQMYHAHLVECLKLLKYSKQIPSLLELHIMMLKYGFWAVFAANNIAPAILYPSDKNSNMDNVMRCNPESDALRYKCFTNPIYVRAMLQLYPFLDKKGIFDATSRK